MENQDSPILITGVQRSGASIIARTIASLGVFTGKCNKLTENVNFKLLLNDLYKNNKCPINAQYPLINNSLLSIPKNWRNVVQYYMSIDGYKSDQKWLYKNHRILQTWRIWKEIYPDAKWIIVRRNTNDIIDSCIQTHYMNAFKNPFNLKKVNAKDEYEGWLWWIYKHKDLITELTASGIDYKIIWPEKMLFGDYTQMKEIVEWIGFQWNDQIINITNPLFYKRRKEYINGTSN
jgi:hypothetical protein